MKKRLKILSFHKYELFCKGKGVWKYSYQQYRRKSNRIYRDTIYSDIEHTKIESIKYRIGYLLHRLDGPAVIEYDNKGKIYNRHWYVLGELLRCFNLYYSYHKIKENLFEYVKCNPGYIQEIELLARHNNWLTEDQIISLNLIALFK